MFNNDRDIDSAGSTGGKGLSEGIPLTTFFLPFGWSLSISVVFAVDSLGSTEYESTEKNPIPPERSCSK